MTDPIIEAAARHMCSRDFPAKWDFISPESREWYCDLARNCLAAVTPMIRNVTLEEAAKAFEPDEDGHDSHSYRWTTEDIATAIRALKGQP